MIALTKSQAPIIAFPENEVLLCLNGWWDEKAIEKADDPFKGPPKKPGTLYDMLPVIDSLTVARGFVRLEKILNMKIPVRVVKKGGFSTRSEMLAHLLPRLQKLYEEN